MPLLARLLRRTVVQPQRGNLKAVIVPPLPPSLLINSVLKKEDKMSFVSVLEHVGKVVWNVFKVGEKVALAAEPFVDAAVPALANVYNTVLASVIQAQTTGEAALAAGSNANANNAMKLAVVIAAVTPTVTQTLATLGIAADKTVVTNYVNAVVALLNTLPAPAPSVPPTT
jgi:hypothetical protein